MRPAMFSRPLEKGRVECRLCAHYCRLDPGQTGVCRVRHNADGQLVTSTYGRPAALAIEPIEKKYLFHAFPGSRTLSLGTPGCNLGCEYCINWRISQRGVNGPGAGEIPPTEIVAQARAARVECLAFTYTEPTIFFEYALEIARLAREAGLRVVAKSNGYMAPAVLRDMATWLDAINIDLKGWRPEAHRRIVGGALEPVLDNLRLAKELGLWLEVSTLLVPGLSVAPDVLENIARFIAGELGADTPWHLLRFYPHYRMLDRAVTAQAELRQAVEIGWEAGLHYVYTKELAEGQMLNTFCPGCRAVVVERKAYGLSHHHLRGGACHRCGQPISGVGLDHELAQPQLNIMQEVL
jgi:pyruvate formate lyase activating enzyme